MNVYIKGVIDRNWLGIIIIVGALFLAIIYEFFGNEGLLNFALITITVLAIFLEQARNRYKHKNQDYEDVAQFIYHLSKKQDIDNEIKEYLKKIDYHPWYDRNALTHVIGYGKVATGKSNRTTKNEKA